VEQYDDSFSSDQQFFGVGMVVFAPEAVGFLYSDKYIAGSQIFAVYSLTYETLIKRRCHIIGKGFPVTTSGLALARITQSQ